MSTKENLRAVTTGQATAAEARNPFDMLKRQLETKKAEFLPILGSIANVDKFIRVVLNACVATPDLVAADRLTLFSACMRAAQDGLLPDGREAVLNIYNTKKKVNGQEQWIQAVQYLPMVGGLIKIMYDSGEVAYVDAAAVYQEDRFAFIRGESPKLEHEPTALDNPGPVIAAYCIVKLKNGEVKREVMFRRDIEAVRAVSKAKDAANGPWVKWYDQQAIKSVIKRIYKQMPKPDRLERIEQSDNEALGFLGMAPGSAIPERTAAPAALEHSPTETLEQSFDFQSAREAMPAERVDQETGELLQDAQQQPERRPSNARAKPEAGPTFAQLADAIQKAKTKEEAAAALAAGANLPEDQRMDLAGLFHELHGGK